MNATTQNTVTIEFCTNDEWLVVFGGYEQDNSSDGTTPSRKAKRLLAKRLKAVESIEGVEVVPAIGQRRLCHGWNGSHFSWRDREFGTFCEMDDELKERIESALNSID